MPAHALSEDVLAETVRLYESGVPTVEIAERYGLHVTTIDHRLRKAGIIRERYRPQKADPVLLAKAVKMYVDTPGISARAVAEAHGIDRNAVNRELKKQGLSRERPKPPPKEARAAIGVPQDVVDVIAKKYKAGKTLSQIMQAHEMSIELVKACLSRAGVEIRKRGTTMGAKPEHSDEFIAEAMTRDLVSRCAKCGAEWSTSAGEAIEGFRAHVPTCPGRRLAQIAA